MKKVFREASVMQNKETERVSQCPAFKGSGHFKQTLVDALCRLCIPIQKQSMFPLFF